MIMARIISRGDVFTIHEDEDGLIEKEETGRYEEPPEEIAGEPWGWTKPGPHPRGWKEDGYYGPE